MTDKLSVFEPAPSKGERVRAVRKVLERIASYMGEDMRWTLPMRLTIQLDIVDHESDICIEYDGPGVRALVTIEWTATGPMQSGGNHV